MYDFKKENVVPTCSHAHFALCLRQILGDQFGNDWIGHGGPWTCLPPLPRSPDTTPFDFFFIYVQHQKIFQLYYHRNKFCLAPIKRNQICCQNGSNKRKVHSSSCLGLQIDILRREKLYTPKNEITDTIRERFEAGTSLKVFLFVCLCSAFQFGSFGEKRESILFRTFTSVGNLQDIFLSCQCEGKIPSSIVIAWTCGRRRLFMEGYPFYSCYPIKSNIFNHSNKFQKLFSFFKKNDLVLREKNAALEVNVISFTMKELQSGKRANTTDAYKQVKKVFDLMCIVKKQ